MYFPDDNSMPFNRSVIIIQSYGIRSGINIKVKDKFLSDDTFRIEGYTEMIC